MDTQLLPRDDKRNILITSALPYVNNVPHLGNIIGCVLSADVYARYCRARGYNVLYICGGDEYGTTTEKKALEEGLSPREICDKYHELHQEIYKWFQISFDYYGRTSCEDPKNDKDWKQTVIAQDIFMKLHQNGYLLEKIVKQVYCTDCQMFLADRYIVGTCPVCGYDKANGDQCDSCSGLLETINLIEPKCKTDLSHRTEIRSSEHLFLDLPSLAENISEWSGKSDGWTDNSVFTTQALLREGLKPRCITRDLKWGTPVPDIPEFRDKYNDKVFYVWFDAPIGYMSITANYTEEWEKWWKNPENVELVHFIGKDNIQFHSIMFPGTLMGTRDEWTLVDRICSTEYLQYEGQKFSKSRGVGVFGDDAMKSGISSDMWRFYLLITRPESVDTNFTWDDFISKINGELVNNLSNLVNRTLSLTYKNFDGEVPSLGELTKEDNEFIEQVDVLLARYHENMEGLHMKAAIRNILDIAHISNKNLHINEPWNLIRHDLNRTGTILHLHCNVICCLAGIIQPYMPGFYERIREILNLEIIEMQTSFSLTIKNNHKINKPTIVYHRIKTSVIDNLKKRFDPKSTN